MEYKQVAIKEDLDVLELSEEEYRAVNKLYYDIISKKNPSLAQAGQIKTVKRVILTDGISRAEVAVILKPA